MRSESLDGLFEQLVAAHDVQGAADSVQDCLDDGVSPQRVLEVIGEAGEELGRRYEEGQYFLPQLFAGADAMSAAVKVVLPALERGGGQLKGVIVIGTVEGDIHDIGKRIVSAMLSGAGFRVHDIGIDVPAERFVAEARALNADVVAASSCFSTTTVRLQDIAEALREAGLREHVHYVIGGAAVSRGMVEWASADGHGQNAAEAARVISALVDEGADQTPSASEP
jgi:5-methyltetrahydrofolate--homocysteine methyltransferase